MPIRRQAIVLGLIMLGMNRESAGVQAVPPIATISGRPVCQSCQIRVTQVAVLGDTSGDGEMPRELRFATMNDRGQYILSFVTPDLPLVYSPTGRFVGRIGKMGRGPGEFTMPVVYHAQNDTVWISDGLNGRITAMQSDRSGWTPAGTWSVPGMPQIPSAMARLLDGSVVYNADVHTHDRIGLPLHLLRFDGPVHSFGALVPEYRPNQAVQRRRLLAPSRRGGLWILHAARYELEQYTQEGRPVARWRRGVPWFPPQREVHRVHPDQPPPPQAFALAEDPAGLVWTFIGVPDPRHREAFGPSPGPGLVDFRSYDRYLDTVIEVFDPSRGAVVASERVDIAILAVVGSARGRLHVVSERRTEAGGWQVVVWELEIAGPTE